MSTDKAIEALEDSLSNLEHIAVFSRSGNTKENIMVYKQRIQNEMLHISGSEEELLTYCYAEWEYFNKTYPDVDQTNEVYVNIKSLLRVDEAIYYFSEQAKEQRALNKQLTELKALCSSKNVSFFTNVAYFLIVAHLLFAIFLILSSYTFLAHIHWPWLLTTFIFASIGQKLDTKNTDTMFEEERKKLGI
jgi:hypothetical protein